MKPTTLRPVSSSISRLMSTSITRCQRPEIEHDPVLASVRQCLLADGQAVLEHDEDAVVADRRLCLCRIAAGRAGERPHDRVRDPGRQLAIRSLLMAGHRDAGPARAGGRSAGTTACVPSLMVSGSEQRGQPPTADAFTEL